MHGISWNYLLVVLAGAALVWMALNSLQANSRKQREAYERAVPALARVLKVASSGPSRSYGAILMDLLIQVHCPGIEPYELSTMWSVDPGGVPKMQAGEVFSIKVDPRNPNKIYSGESWARSLGVMKHPIEL